MGYVGCGLRSRFEMGHKTCVVFHLNSKTFYFKEAKALLLKNTMEQIKNSIEGLNNRMYEAEERIS